MRQHNSQDITAIKLAILLVTLALLLFSCVALKEENHHGEKRKTCGLQTHTGVCQS